MFKNEEFKEWCTKLKLPDNAIEKISRIRKSEPSRNVGGGSKNVVGAYPSQKMGRSIQFESHKVELPGIYIKEHNDLVREYYDQPDKIKLSYKSKKDRVVYISHTPDYFVILEDKAGWEEWKTEEELHILAEDSPSRYVLIDGEWHCPPGEAYAQKFGLHYWVKSSSEIKWQLQRNIIFLEDYYLDKKTDISPDVVDTVISCVRAKTGILLCELLETSGVAADDIYYMLAREQIFVDMEQELLIEPDYTHVFGDKQSATAYKTLTGNINMPKFSDHTLDVAPGVKVIWDKISWIIVNIGDKYITLSSQDNRLIDISKDQFFNLVTENKIKGAENEIVKSINFTLNSILEKASKQGLEIAGYRYNVILPILEGAGIEDIKEIGVTPRTIRNWLNSYKQAEQQYGSGYIGLIPRINERGNRIPHLAYTTLNLVNEFLDENETVKNQSKIVLYGKLSMECDKRGIDAPSMKTFYKIIKSRPKYQRLSRTQGNRVAYQQDEFYWELDMTTPRHGERPFQIAHIDHTPIDLELVHYRTGKRLGKAWLTTLMDAFSRKVLSFYISFDAPSYKSNMAVIRDCVRRYNRLPQTIVMDNGKDFRSIYLLSLLTYYNVTYKFRPPHKPRFGSVGERLFGTTMSQLIHNLQGNTKIMKKVREVTKSVNPKNHAVWTLPNLYELLSDYFYEFYDTREHSALGESPREAFERGIELTGKRPFRFIAYNEDFLILTLPACKKNNGTAKVDPQRGVKVNYFYYYCSEFQKPDVEGTRVQVRYDPWNAGNIRCLVRNRWVKCYSQYYSVLKNKSENEIKIASQELLEQKKSHARKAKLSARELADFIMRAEQTEEMLRQRFCDEEMATQLQVINGGLDNSLTDESYTNYESDFEDDEINFDLKEY